MGERKRIGNIEIEYNKDGTITIHLEKVVLRHKHDIVRTEEIPYLMDVRDTTKNLANQLIAILNTDNATLYLA